MNLMFVKSISPAITTRGIICFIACIFAWYTFNAEAQRRRRPGSMHHTQQEVEKVTAEKVVKAKYIHDGALFTGQAKMTNGAAAIKVGDVTISLNSGRYRLSFVNQEFSARTALSKKERLEKGISDYEYDNSWKMEKFGKDFSNSGPYAVIERNGEFTLYLYHGDNKEKVFATIPLSGPDASSFQFDEGGILFDMKLSN